MGVIFAISPSFLGKRTTHRLFAPAGPANCAKEVK
jgi:hypothetical protein